LTAVRTFTPGFAASRIRVSLWFLLTPIALAPVRRSRPRPLLPIADERLTDVPEALTVVRTFTPGFAASGTSVSLWLGYLYAALTPVRSFNPGVALALTLLVAFITLSFVAVSGATYRRTPGDGAMALPGGGVGQEAVTA
jgi:hypothetical protein